MDLHPALQGIAFVGQAQPALAAFKEDGKYLLELFVNGLEGFPEEQPAGVVEAADAGPKIGHGLGEFIILVLVAFVFGLEFRLSFNGPQADLAHVLQLGLESVPPAAGSVREGPFGPLAAIQNGQGRQVFLARRGSGRARRSLLVRLGTGLPGFRLGQDDPPIPADILGQALQARLQFNQFRLLAAQKGLLFLAAAAQITGRGFPGLVLFPGLGQVPPGLAQGGLALDKFFRPDGRLFGQTGDLGRKFGQLPGQAFGFPGPGGQAGPGFFKALTGQGQIVFRPAQPVGQGSGPGRGLFAGLAAFFQGVGLFAQTQP